MAHTVHFRGGPADGQSFSNPFDDWPPPDVVSMFNTAYELIAVRDGVAQYVPYSSHKVAMRQGQRRRMRQEDKGCQGC